MSEFYFRGNLTGVAPILSTMIDGGSSWSTQSYPNSTSGTPPVSITIFSFSLCNFQAPYSLTGYSVTFSSSQTFDPGQIAGKSCVMVVRRSTDSTNGSDGNWTIIATHTLTVNADGSTNPTTFNNSFAALDATMVRCDITLVANRAGSGTTPITATITHSAFTLTATPVIPDTPVNLHVSDLCGPLTFTWDAVSTATSYTLALSDGTVLYTGSDAFYAVPGIDIDETISVKVRANNAGGSSPYSNPVSGTQGGIPETPTDFVNSGTNFTVDLSWSEEEGYPSIAFRVFRLTSTLYDGTNQTLSEILTAADYPAVYSVVAYNDCGVSSAATLTLTLPPLNPWDQDPSGAIPDWDQECSGDVPVWTETCSEGGTVWRQIN